MFIAGIMYPRSLRRCIKGSDWISAFDKIFLNKNEGLRYKTLYPNKKRKDHSRLYMNITVLRLGHRPQRDKRLSTHLLLCARALGVEKVIYSGSKDPRLEESIINTVKRWGGEFIVKYESDWRKTVDQWKGNIAHLTMYGIPVEKVAPTIRNDDNPLLIVVGGPKVPRDLYEKATWNISITNQPHSEVSALALFIYILKGERALGYVFNGSSIKITPCKKGKHVEVSKD